MSPYLMSVLQRGARHLTVPQLVQNTGKMLLHTHPDVIARQQTASSRSAQNVSQCTKSFQCGVRASRVCHSIASGLADGNDRKTRDASRAGGRKRSPSGGVELTTEAHCAFQYDLLSVKASGTGVISA